MGDKLEFQPLTREDRITTVLYRLGIVLSAVIISALAFLLHAASARSLPPPAGAFADLFAYGLYASVGMSVYFIHLYVGAFKRFLKNLYFISLGCLGVLFFIGNGSVVSALSHVPYSSLLLLPLSGCLGFVTAKEAFCFRLFEGYLLAMLMPIYLLLVSKNILSDQGASYGLVLISAMLVMFTLRKVFQPLAWDIGDKSAYR